MIYALPFLLSLIAQRALACKNIVLTGDTTGSLNFRVMPFQTAEGINSGRASYASTAEPTVYLYHTTAQNNSGRGRWVIDSTLGSRSSAFTFIDTWAVMPTLTHAVNDEGKTAWQAQNSPEGWASDPSITLYCAYDGFPTGEDEENEGNGRVSEAVDNTVYLTSEHATSWITSGFYTEIESVATEENNFYSGPLFSQVGAPNSKNLFMFKFGSKWLVGERPGVDEAYAWVDDDAFYPSGIQNTEWYFLNDGEWNTYNGSAIISGDMEMNIYGRLRQHRTVGYLPTQQDFARLRNDLVMPSVGLGTGNIPVEELAGVIENSLHIGYRMFDLAREYRNERYLQEAVRAESINGEVKRGDFFVVSKVWPTELGVDPTLMEVTGSLIELQSSYVDLYLLHWPECDPSVEWMHCETTVEEGATWQESWEALERSYAEGRVMAIGVSNFNIDLLNEAKNYPISPFAVQNFAEPGNPDMPTQHWCNDNNAVFMPYATIRNLDRLAPEVKSKLSEIAEDNGRSVASIANKFFVQMRAVIIPRATNTEHLRQNLDLFTWTLQEEEMSALGWVAAASGDAEL